MVSTDFASGRSSERRQKARDLVAKLLERWMRGEQIDESQVLAEFPDLQPELWHEWQNALRIHAALNEADSPRSTTGSWSSLLGGLEASADASPDEMDDSIPPRLGRYEVEGLIGQGGFARVLLGWDHELSRHVAIKVPRASRLRDPEAVATYLAEARLLAKLDHANIVPIYDAGRTDEGGCYLVSKWIEGIDLATRLRRSRVTRADAVRITLEIAAALRYAHERGVIHRDIKPGNILLDADQHAYLADFGLASQDTAVTDSGEHWAGTPAYMSPEQARGESHRVDPRSDLFSLGVVLYELLSGARPFRADSREQLLHQIVTHDPVSLRHFDAQLPAELERICFKLLAKRAADRYSHAQEFIFDLRHFAQPGDHESSAPARRFSVEVTRDSHDSERGAERTRIIPKGLRSFDANDAAFFLELLPGPRDRHGLPESLRRWKSWIEESDGEQTFSVGLMYGPSGCGKSSLVRAGLLPQLASHVETIYLEATADETESQLLRRIHKRFPRLPRERGLAATLAALRRGAGFAPSHKLLIVIDQFEQWLSGRDEAARRPLVEALRQCDGSRLQCLLTVRDDFWLAVSRFMTELEVQLQQGSNTALVDLFDPKHARKVLIDFGQAYDRLPAAAHDFSPTQREFLDAAVAGLTEDGKVIPVRLALFVEMVKMRVWEPATLRSIGGAQGVGVNFLEETFCARSANPIYRAHERGARAVLEALLPTQGSPIKGHVRSYPDLLDVSGYGDHPRRFKELMRALDAETRLLTPADLVLEPGAGAGQTPPLRYYQLTHDYLVPSLREWLVKKQRGTPAGRATLRLNERSALWDITHERRQLPSIWEWWSIRLFTRSSGWTANQRHMMRVAARRQGTLGLVWTAALLLLLVVGAEATNSAADLFLRVRAATAPVWLAFGQEEALFPLLEASPDPTLRTRLIHGLSPLLISPDRMIGLSMQPMEPGIRRGLLLAAGEMLGEPEDSATHTELSRLPIAATTLDMLKNLYATDPDPGVHAAAQWLLHRLQQSTEVARLNDQLKSQPAQSDRLWYLTSEEHTLVIVPGPARLRPRHGSLAAPARELLIGRSFSMAHQEVTGAQFLRFLATAPPLRGARSSTRHTLLGADEPALEVTWYEAAAYCNWLSEREGIPPTQWCFLPNAAGRYDEGMTLAPNWISRSGYRLPLDVEWEYACRAGAETQWPFGADQDLLNEFAQYAPRSNGVVRLVGHLKPNDLGLFDTLGNAAEWCLEPFEVSSNEAVRGKLLDPVTARTPRVIRGGSYLDPAASTDCSTRRGMLPTQPGINVGFRVARSYP